MVGAEAAQQVVDHLEVRAALARRLDQLGAVEHAGVAATAVVVVVLEEHGGGQHDVGHFRRVGQELLMNDCEQILASETGPRQALLGGNINGVGVLDEQCLNGAAALQGLGIAG